MNQIWPPENSNEPDHFWEGFIFGVATCALILIGVFLMHGVVG